MSNEKFLTKAGEIPQFLIEKLNNDFQNIRISLGETEFTRNHVTLKFTEVLEENVPYTAQEFCDMVNVYRVRGCFEGNDWVVTSISVKENIKRPHQNLMEG